MMSLFSSLGTLVFATTVIVEVLKKILPAKFPTQILTVIVSILVSVGMVLCLPEITIAATVQAIFTGLAASFISMYGFDTFKDLYNRFNLSDKKDDEEE